MSGSLAEFGHRHLPHERFKRFDTHTRDATRPLVWDLPSPPLHLMTPSPTHYRQQVMSESTVENKRRKKKRKPAPPPPQPKKKVEDNRPEVLVQKTAAAARKLAADGSHTEALQMMAQAFEQLDEADGIDPWEPGTLLAWASSQPRHVELMARFVVSLEDPDDAAFPIHEALKSWDELSRLAFATWAIRVWWAS